METITIKDIARICGVGVSTVSRAMNDHPDINAETKQKVMDVIREYNYVPNNSARNLKRTDSNTIALLVKGVDNSFFGKMIRVIEEEIEKKKYSILVRHVEPDEDEVSFAMELEKERLLKGIIFLGGFYAQNAGSLKLLKVPVVLVTSAKPQYEEEEYYSSVSVDDIKESYRMVDYLCERGHRKIAILTATKYDNSVGKLRLMGYEKALKQHGIAVNPKLIRYMEDSEDYSMENGYRLMSELLDENESFTGVFAISDSLAVGACRALHDRGFRIPEDVSVAGFDGMDIATYYTPSLTTIKQPIEKIAKEATRMLFQVIRKKAKHTHIYFDGELIVRESTQ